MNKAAPRAALHEGVARQQRRLTIDKGMQAFHSGQLGARNATHDLIPIPTAFLGHAAQQRHRHEVTLLLVMHHRVIEGGIERDRQVGRQGPRRGGPNHHKRARMADQGEFDEDAGAHVVFVFDLGFRQRGAARDAPIHRLFAAIDKALSDDIGEHTQLVGLILRRQGEIGIFPFAQNAQALELAAL